MKNRSRVRNRTKKEDIVGTRRSRGQTGKSLKDIVAKGQSRGQSGNMLAVFVAAGVMLLLVAVGTANAMQSTQVIGPPQAKLQELAREQQLMDQSRALHRPKPVPHTPPVQPAPVRHAGIVNMHQGPFSSMQFTVRNFWQGPVGSNWELVYAGAKVNPDSSAGLGALRLYTEVANADGGFDIHYLGTYVVPNSSGALTIIAVNGYIMQLHTDAGRQLTFNLQNNQYH